MQELGDGSKVLRYPPKNKIIKMKYKDCLKESMELLSKDDKVLFIGYNVARGSRANGSLVNISTSRCIETPCAENLMAGLSIGLGFKGFKPVLYFERHDFMLNALDALVNHLDKSEQYGKESFRSPMIIRAVVGGTRPFYPGRQHTQDFTLIFKDLFHFPVYDLHTPGEVIESYRDVSRFEHSSLLVEHKDLYELEEVL